MGAHLMLLCGIDDIRPGMVLGTPVRDPKSPELQLLREGVVLDAALLASVRKRGVTQLWVEDDLTRDLDAAVANELSGAKLEVYARLRDDLGALSKRTLSVSSVQGYRRAVMGLVTQAMASKKYASMTDPLFQADGLATHAANVAYLSLLCGLHLETYVVAEQPKLSHEQARDMSVLGMAGMLHDIGKTRIAPSLRDGHDVHRQEEGAGGGEVGAEGGEDGSSREAALAAYRAHATVGHEMLSGSRTPARVAHAVLNHHQRFDGKGWPDLTRISAGRINGPLAGRRIHIFARIVAAANVLDNLLREADGTTRPPVAALHAFASARFEGWFDPLVRRTLLLRVPPFAMGTDVRLSDGRRGVVMAPNLEQPCRPVVRLLTDAEGTRATEAVDLALGATLDVSVTHAAGVDVSRYGYEVPPATPSWKMGGESERQAA